MKVIEKFNYKQSALKREFKKYLQRPGQYDCHVRYESRIIEDLRTQLHNEHWTVLFDWLFSEYPKYRKFQILWNDHIILNEIPDNKQNIIIVGLFSVGWEYWVDEWKRLGKDLSKPFLDMEFPCNFYSARWKPKDEEQAKEQTLKKINDILIERGKLPLPPDKPWKYVSPYTDKTKPYYETYIAAIQYLKQRLLDGKDQWEDMELLKRMGLEKWV